MSTLTLYGRASSRFPAKVAIDFIEYERSVCKYSFQTKCQLRTSSVISETCFSPLAALLTVVSILLAPMEQKQNRFNLFDLHVEKCVTKIESYTQARMSLLNNMNYM